MKDQKLKYLTKNIIPEGWNVVRLGNKMFFNLIMGQSPPSSTYNEDGIGLPFLQGCAEFGKMFPKPVLYCSNPIKIAKPGDILISIRAPVGEINLVKTEICIGRGLAALHPNPRYCEIYYAYYALQRSKGQFQSRSSGSTFKAITKTDLESVQIPLPPLPEQKRIAEVLLTVDEAIFKVEKEIEHTERLKQGLMRHLLSRGIGHTKFKITKVGLMPVDWKIRKLSEITKCIKRGPWGSSVKKEIFVESGNPVYEQRNVIQNDFSYFRYFINRQKFKELSAFQVKEGDILITAAGTIGEITVVPKGSPVGIINQALIKITVNEKLADKYYVVFYFKYMLRHKILLQYSFGATMKNIASVKLLHNILVPLPPLPEQKKIAEILMTVDGKLELLRKKKEHLERIKKGLMNDLLTGRRRLKVVNDS